MLFFLVRRSTYVITVLQSGVLGKAQQGTGLSATLYLTSIETVVHLHTHAWCRAHQSTAIVARSSCLAAETTVLYRCSASAHRTNQSAHIFCSNNTTGGIKIHIADDSSVHHSEEPYKVFALLGQIANGVLTAVKRSLELMLQRTDGLESSAIKAHVDVLCQHNADVRLSGGNHLTYSGKFSCRAHLIDAIGKDRLVITQLLVHPQHTAFHIIPYHIHFGIPCAPYLWIAMHLLEQVGPSDMIQACRCTDFRAKRIHVCTHILRIEATFVTECRPDVAKLLPSLGIRQDPVHHAVPSAGTPYLVSPFLTFVSGIYIIVVVQRQVIVPYRTGINERIHAFLPHKYLPEHVCISAELIGQKILQERFQIQMGAVSQ